MKRAVMSCFLLLFAGHLSAARLTRTVIPIHYELSFTPDFRTDSFEGRERIHISLQVPARRITLHALEIDFHEVSISAGNGPAQKASVTLDPAAETVMFEVEKQLPTGPATIDIRYTGKLNNELRGFYLGRANGRKYAASQLENTDARRAFPSFDEPSMKASFDITIVADRGDVAFSNGSVLSDVPGPGEGKHTIRFSTTPRMSSYLVALVVGDFKCLEGSSEGIPLRICSTPDKVGMGRFALEATEYFMKYFNRYYGVKYPFGKLDQIAIADFRAGAMENTAAVIYRETALLLDEKIASVSRKKYVASVIAHEMAHMWFGDLVTMEWWDDIWLNEGFASWMEDKAVDAWKPAWNMKVDQVLSTGGPMSLDGLKSTRAIRTKAESSAQIDELFDPIAYGKTAALLRMVESYIGEESFRTGINHYIEKHAYGNTTAHDFTAALATGTDKPVVQIVNSFINQPGLPIIEAVTACESGKTKVTLSQRRFSSDRIQFAEESQELWTVPVCMSIGEKGERRCVVLDQRKKTFVLPGCQAPVLINAGGRGYYVSSYARKDLERLRTSVAQLAPAERLTLLRDEWYLVRVGKRPIAEFLDLTSSFRSERETAVVAELLKPLKFIEQYLPSDTGQRQIFQTWVRGLLQPVAKELGWRSSPSEGDDRRNLRANVFQNLGYLGRDPEVLRESARLAEAYLKDPAAVDPSMAGTVMSLAALEGGKPLYEKFLVASRKARTPDEYIELLEALATFRDPELIQRTLELALTPEIRVQDTSRLLNNVMANPEGTALGWKFQKARWKEIEGKLSDRMLAALSQGVSSFCNPAMAEEIRTFYKAHPVASGERRLSQSLERVAACADLKATQGASFAQWLSRQKENKPGV